MNEQVEDDVRRAMKAVMEAPATPSGIVLPPHVAEEQQREAAKAATRPQNRAQRRRQAKWERSAAARRQAAVSAQHTPEQQVAIDRVKEANDKLTEDQLEIVQAFVARLTKMTPLEREQAFEDFKREHGGDE